MAAKESAKKTATSPANSDGVPTIVTPVPWYRQLLLIKDTLIVILTPLVFLPIIIVNPSRASKCAYGILIVAVFWMTECLPMAVTAMLPVVFMPWLGVMDSRAICMNYLKDANFLFLGGLMISIAVERWGLHKRVALRVLLLVGSKPVWITFGFMLVTAFLSMWLANIPTTAMMIPIAAAVLKELDIHRKRMRELRRQARLGMEMKPMQSEDGAQNNQGSEQTTPPPYGNTVIELDGSRKQSIHRDEVIPLNENDEAEWQRIYDKEDTDFRHFSCALKLSITYACNIGGTGTIIGCGPNIVFKGQAESLFGPDTGINFFSFFIFAFPNMIIILPLAWLVLMVVFIGPKLAFCPPDNEDEKGENSANAVIRKEYEKLGPLTWPEAWVMICFFILTALWISKEPQFVPGWQDLLPNRYVTDSVVAVTVCMALFVLPSRRPNVLCCRRSTDTTPPGPTPALLDWPTVHKEMQWGVILLLGGGFAIADACRVSGLSVAIGDFLSVLKPLPPWVVVLLVTLLACCVTTFTSNVSSGTLLTPIAAELAIGIGVNPLYLMLPVVIAVSFSYLLPVSTPSNAIIFAYGDITVPDMLKVGFINVILHVLVLQLAINTWGYSIFNLGEFPAWARKGATLAPVGNDTLLGVTPLFNDTLMF